MATSVTLKPNAIDISGSTSGTTTLQASAVAGTTTLTLPAATDTLVGKATTDTLTNKTLTTPSVSSPTISDGTANGVAYLNGSKVLTTGSALVFDGTNLRVGTTSSLSVADKLTVVGGNFAVQRTSGITTFMGDNTADGYAGTATNHAFALLTNSIERARIDTSGNLGLGVTPSAWGNGRVAFDIKSNGAVYSGSNMVGLAGNAYDNGSWRYKANAGATLYEASSQHAWYIAASGTAGNAISWTQAMTLDASGNLGLGSTSPSSFLGSGNKLVVGNPSTSTTSAGISIYSGTATYGGLYFADGTVGDQLYRGGIEYNHSTDALLLYSSGIERCRIDSSGNLLVASTAVSTPTAGGFTINPSGQGAGTPAIARWNKSASGNYYAAQFMYNGSIVGTIEVSNTATAFVTSSDYRLKENIAPMTGALSVVQQLKPCTYTWKSEGSAGQGFIAHELQAIVPDAVVGEKDAVNEDGTIKPQGIDTSFLVATLTAAIQEQQAIIQSLTDRITALESA